MDSKSKHSLQCVCIYVSACVLPETACLLSTAVLSLSNRNYVVSLSHTNTHTLAFPLALKTAAGSDPCHVNSASSAPLGRLKCRLAFLAPDKIGLGSNQLAQVPTVKLLL